MSILVFFVLLISAYSDNLFHVLNKSILIFFIVLNELKEYPNLVRLKLHHSVSNVLKTAVNQIELFKAWQIFTKRLRRISFKNLLHLN